MLPSLTNFLIAVLLTISPSIFAVSITSVSKPYSEPILFKSSKLPCLFLPKEKSGPTIRCLSLRFPTNISVTKSSADIFAISLVNV